MWFLGNEARSTLLVKPKLGTLKAQSFTSLKEDLCQDISKQSRCFAFNRFLNGTGLKGFGIICICYSSSHHLGWYINVLMKQFLQGNVRLKHLFFKWKKGLFMHFLMEIFHQRYMNDWALKVVSECWCWNLRSSYIRPD